MRHQELNGSSNEGVVGHGMKAMSAQGYRQRFTWLNSFSDEELQKISFCDENVLLKEGEHYLDLSHPERGIIEGGKGSRSPEGSCYVARSQVSAALWRKLTSPFTTQASM